MLGKFAPDRDEEDPIDLEFNGFTPSAEPAVEDESSEGSSNSDSADDDDNDSDDDDDDDNDDDDDSAADVRATETDTAVRAAAQGGTPDSSFEQFLAEWDDDDDESLSKVADSDAATHAKPPKVPAKRASGSGSSSAAAPAKVAKTSKAVPKGKQPTAASSRPPAKPLGKPKGGSLPRDAPLDIPPLNFRLPMGAPRASGYGFFFAFVLAF